MNFGWSKYTDLSKGRAMDRIRASPWREVMRRKVVGDKVLELLACGHEIDVTRCKPRQCERRCPECMENSKDTR